MQITSSGWAHNVAKAHRRIGYGALVSWLRTTASGVNFFTIGQSRIGGMDIIKGGGAAVTFYDKFAFTDYTQYVLSWSVTRKLGQYPYGTIMAQADLELDNTSRLFLPGYDNTIGSGILPNRPMKLSVGIEDEYLKLFVGFTGQPETTLGERITRLHAFDAFNYINNYKITYSGAITDKYSHEIMDNILSGMGFSASQYVLDTSLQQKIGYVAPNDMLAGDLFAKLVEAEQAMMFADENGTIRFWNRQHFTTLSGTDAFSLSYSKLSDLQWQNTPVINDVIVRAKPRSLAALQKIWESASPIELEPGVDTEYFINFSDDFGALPTTQVDMPKYITTASGSSYYATNVQSDGSGAANDSYVSIIDAYNFGDSYKLTIRNSFTSRMYLTQLVIYARPAKVQTVIEERYTDAASIDAYGRNPANNGEPLVIENDLIQDRSTANSLAYTLVKEYKDPRKRYVAPWSVGSDPSLQIGDQGKLSIADTGEIKSVYVTGIEHKFEPNGKYGLVLELEERNIKRYFTINQSKIGGTDSIAP